MLTPGFWGVFFLCFLSATEINHKYMSLNHEIEKKNSQVKFCYNFIFLSVYE